MNDIATHVNNNKSLCTCPHCNSTSLTRSGFDRGIQRYRCKNCLKTFKATAGTPVHGLHKKEKIAKYLKALQKGMSIRKAAKFADISNNTSFAWRHKFLSSLEARSVVQTSSKTASTGIIQIEYSAKGRRKPPEAHTTPTKTLLLHCEDQLVLHKLYPIRQTRHVAQIFSDSRIQYYAASPNKTISAGIKHSAKAIKIESDHIKMPLIAKAEKQKVKLLSWMDRFKGVASKYLQNYWNWYSSLLNLIQLKQEFEQFCRLCTCSRSLASYNIAKNI